MNYDVARALASGALLYATYWLMQLTGVLDGKSKGRQRLTLAVAFAVVILLLNLVWPTA